MGPVIFLAWIFFGILVGIFASNRNRSGFAWGVAAFLFSPLATWLLLLALGPGSTPEPAADYTSRPCPFCAEPIKKEAIKCKHCGSDVGTTATTTTPKAQAPSTGEWTG